jgi:hypothetical protein
MSWLTKAAAGEMFAMLRQKIFFDVEFKLSIN